MASVSTPPPKPRGRHQHSKSATPTAMNHHDIMSASARPNQRRQKGNRNYDQNVPAPANPADQVFNQLVGNGPLMAPVDFRSDEAAASDGQPRNRSRKGRGRPRKQNQEGNTGLASPPASGGENAKATNDSNMHTPAKKQMAYAGPTFHASPAPSALPVPKFFSKSVPNSQHPAGLQAQLDEESDQSMSPPADEDDASGAPEVVPQESPLDFFFKADREEKAMKSGGLLTPNAKPNHAKSVEGLVNGSARPASHARQTSTGSPRGMFPLELDGNGVSNGYDSLPANSAQRRIITRSVTSTSVVQTASSTPSHGEMDDVNQKLKDMLFSIPNPATTLPSPPMERPQVPSEPNSRFQTPSPFYRPNSVPGSAPVLGASNHLSNGTNPQLHYGNRNLSPLFKAARNDMTQRPSNLRQEVGGRAYHHNHNTMPQLRSNFAAAGGQSPPVQDSSAISRNFLNLHIQSQGQMADLTFRKNTQHLPPNAGVSMGLPANNTHPLQYHASPGSGALNITNGAQNSIVPPLQSRNQPLVSSAPSVDIQSMENDLRRMLNLNLVGSGVR